MQQESDLHHEIEALRNQLNSKGKEFDEALKRDVQLAAAKKIFHEMREIQRRLDGLISISNKARGPRMDADHK